MKKLVTMLQLYSVQVLAILAAINTTIAASLDVPWWVVLIVNVVGVVVGMIAREVPQPVVAAKLAALRHP